MPPSSARISSARQAVVRASWRAIATTPASTRTRFRARQFRVMLRYGPSALRRACAILANRFRARRRVLSDFVRSTQIRERRSATPARSFFSPLVLCRGIEPAAPWSATPVQHKCSISAASVQSKCSFFAVEVQSFCLPFCSRIVARRPTLKASAMRTLFGASLTPRNPTTPYAPTRCR